MKDRIPADAIFLLHAVLFPLVLFGWTMPSLWYPYIASLVAVLLSDLLFGYCILSKWEFDLRKKIDPTVNYDFTWSSYYTSRLFGKERFSNSFWKTAALIFLLGSLAINLYFRYFFS